LAHEKFHHLIRDILIKFMKVEVLAAAALLKTEIFIFTWQAANQRYQWLCYKPITSHQCSVSTCPATVQKLWKLQPPVNYHIELIHFSFQNHFDRVSSSDLTCTSMENTPHLSSDVEFSKQYEIGNGSVKVKGNLEWQDDSSLHINFK